MNPLVKAELQNAISIDKLLAHTTALEDIAMATSGRNRVAGSEGYDNSVKYVVDQLKALGDYYDVKLEPFDFMLAMGNATLLVDGREREVSLFRFSPSGSITGKAVLVQGAGSNAVSIIICPSC